MKVWAGGRRVCEKAHRIAPAGGTAETEISNNNMRRAIRWHGHHLKHPVLCPYRKGNKYSRAQMLW